MYKTNDLIQYWTRCSVVGVSVLFSSSRFVVRSVLLALVAFRAADAALAGEEAVDTDGTGLMTGLDRQVIVGVRNGSRLVDAPVRTEVVTPSDARALQAVKLSDALEYTPGLRVESTCQNCNATEIRLLGLPQRYVAVLQDGIPGLSGLAGVYGLEQIPIALVDQVEVVKGGGSVLYGPGAVAGVVNVVPRVAREPGGVLEASVNFMPGSGEAWRPNRDLTGVADLLTPGRSAGLTLYGINSVVNAVDVDGDGYSEVARRDWVAGGARAWWKPRVGTRVLLDYLGSDEARRGGEMSGDALDAPPDTVGIAEDLKSRRHVGSVVWEQELVESWDLRMAAGIADTHRKGYYGGTGPLGGPADPDWDPGLPFESEAPVDGEGRPMGPFNLDPRPGLGFGVTTDRLYYAEAMLKWHAGSRHVVTAGVQYRMERLRDRAEYREFGDSYENVGVVMQDEWEMGDRWDVVYGVRVDRHGSLKNPVVSPRVAVQWEARDDLKWRGAVSTGFRPPELFDEDLHVSNVGGDLQVVQRSPGLEEESSVTVTLGPEWKPGGRWVVDANLFYTRLSGTFFNELDAVQDDPGLQRRTKVNAGGAMVAGGELNVAYRLADEWRVEAGWVEQRSRFDDAQLLLGDPGDPVDNPVMSRDFVRTPDRYGVIRMFWTPGSWRLFAGGRVTGPMDVPHVVNDLVRAGNPSEGSYPGQPRLLENRLERSPWFVVMDVSVARDWKLGGGRMVTGTVGCRNLTDSFQDDLDRGKYRDAAYVYGPRFPRTFFATVSVTF